jgi:hypothetical protein
MKSFFDLSSKLNEAIEAYSPQALGRKRNTMLRALTLDDSEFERWVHDRVIRFAEQNGIALQQLDVSAFKQGFNEWQAQLQQSDTAYPEVKDQVSQYVSRFLAIAPGIIAKFQSGQAAPVEEPMSPTMVPYEADGQQSQQAAEGGEAGEVQPEPQYATSPAPTSPEQIQGSQRDVMAFMDMIDNINVNMGDQEVASNRAAFKEQVRNLADQIADANGVTRQQLNYEMVDSYVNSIRQMVETNVDSDLDIPLEDLDMWEQMIKQQFAEDYGLIQPQRDIEERARLQAQQQADFDKKAMDPKMIKKIDAQDAEVGLIHAIERLTDVAHLSPVQRARANKKMGDVQKRYFDIQAQAMFEKYPFLKDASFKHVGRTKGELTDKWSEFGPSAAAARTPKTDIVATLADGNQVRYDEGSGQFVRCSMREIEDGMCTNTMTFSMKKGPSQLMSARDKETLATLETAVSNLTDMGYDFNDEKSITQAIMQNQQLDEETASQRAQATLQTVSQIRDLSKQFIVGKTFKGQVSFYQPGGEYRDSQDLDMMKTQEIIDSAEPFLEQINGAITNLSQNMPELLGEMAYIAASGNGKFKEGTKEVASHFLSLSTTDPTSGPKIIPITRPFMYNIAQNALQAKVVWKSQSVAHTKKKLKPLMTKQAMQQGLEGEELEANVRKRMDAELPYTFSTVLRMFMQELPDTKMEQVRASIGKFLKEGKEDMLADIQGVSPMTKKYAQEGFKWAFSNMDNLTKFFEMTPEVSDVNLPDFNEDFGDTYFKKEIQDEVQDLDML